jgi:hypothetical protein
LPLILELEECVRKKLSRLFKNLNLSPAPL